MRICLIGKARPRIPPEDDVPVTIYLHTLAQQLVLLGHSIDVVCSPSGRPAKQAYNIIEIGNLMRPSWGASFPNFHELWFSLRLGMALRRLCRRNNYDVVHFFENPAPSFLALLFAGKGMPPFVFSSGLPVSGAELTWAVQSRKTTIWRISIALHKRVYRGMTRLTTSSSQLKEVVTRQAGVDPAKITVTPFIAAETDVFYPDVDCAALRAELGLGDRSLVVLCLAPIAPYKNQLSLVRAIPAIIGEFPEARFLFVGEITRDHHYSEITEFIRTNSLEDHVTFTDFIERYPDLPRYYSLAGIYVLLSLAEGNLPKTTLEAMSCGKPVVISDIPQNREGVGDEGGAIFVDPLDADGIANAITTLLRDPELRRATGEAARRTIMERHTPEVVARGIVRVYEEVVGGKAAG